MDLTASLVSSYGAGYTVVIVNHEKTTKSSAIEEEWAWNSWMDGRPGRRIEGQSMSNRSIRIFSMSRGKARRAVYRSRRLDVA